MTECIYGLFRRCDRWIYDPCIALSIWLASVDCGQQKVRIQNILHTSPMMLRMDFASTLAISHMIKNNFLFLQ